ncbi:MAG TPA: murein biosynthesis integral membrane protein MurJ, partial [Anaerolineaceae bacterium]|nr:murein biosynthesis integral membrane protein MurJ [Anaerolineaceae bacterium]
MPTPASQKATRQANRQIARGAGIVMLAFVLGNLIGLARSMILVRVYGTSLELDSFYAANRLAEALFNLVAGGALGSAFIPTFTALLTQERRTAAWRLASAIANLILVVLIGVALLATLFAPQVVEHVLFLLNPAQDPIQQELTTNLLRVLLPTVVIFGLSGLVMGILNAHQVFLVPAIAPAMYSLGMILGVLVLPDSLGIFRLAWGALGGAVLHLLVQVPRLLRLGGRYTPTFGLHLPEVREVARLMGPRLIGVAVVQVNFIVNTIIALSLPDGSVSAITQGFTLMLMPQMAIAQAIAIAAMPTFSAQVARGRSDELRGSLAASLRMVLLLSFPAALGLILLRQPLVGLLYQDGVCGPGCTQMIAWALLWYAVGLVGHSLVEIISRAFYALHDTRTPVIVGVGAMSLNIVLSLLLADGFARLGWMPHGGLALANSLATSLEMVLLLALMRRRLGGLEGPAVARSALQAGAAGLGMLCALAGWLALSARLPDGLIVLGGVAAGVAVYGLLLAVLRVDEIGQVLGLLQRA